MTVSVAAVAASAFLLLISGSEARAAPPSKPAETTAEIVCSYAPSQSVAVAHFTGVAGGSAAASAALAQALGLSVVTHSSGALILSGGSGYIAGTIGVAASGPALIGVGVTVAGVGGAIELICAPRNHPEMVAKVEAAAEEFWRRSQGTISIAKESASNFVIRQKLALIKSGEDAIALANRKAEEVSKEFKR